ACVKLLKHTGLSERQSSRELAPFLALRLGSSRRGRPIQHEREAPDNAGTVRSLYRKFDARICSLGSHWANGMVQEWFWMGLSIWAYNNTGQIFLCPRNWQPSGYLVPEKASLGQLPEDLRRNSAKRIRKSCTHFRHRKNDANHRPNGE